VVRCAEPSVTPLSGALNDRFHETVSRKGPERRISSSRGAGIFCGTLKRDEASANRYRDLGANTRPRSMRSTSQQMDRATLRQ
jgi:hypothetical protein